MGVANVRSGGLWRKVFFEGLNVPPLQEAVERGQIYFSDYKPQNPPVVANRVKGFLFGTNCTRIRLLYYIILYYIISVSYTHLTLPTKA